MALESEAASDSVEAVEAEKLGEGSDSKSDEVDGEEVEGDDDAEARIVLRRDGRLAWLASCSCG